MDEDEGGAHGDERPIPSGKARHGHDGRGIGPQGRDRRRREVEGVETLRETLGKAQHGEHEEAGEENHKGGREKAGIEAFRQPSSGGDAAENEAPVPDHGNCHEKDEPPEPGPALEARGVEAEDVRKDEYEGEEGPGGIGIVHRHTSHAHADDARSDREIGRVAPAHEDETDSHGDQREVGGHEGEGEESIVGLDDDGCEKYGSRGGENRGCGALPAVHEP